uniref:G_PROTEIN_RECEP_F1_2 domain-containing protein n=1 Tax=Caenorhabditis tropicalis TaxID=1561998 RepID=A0A1I7UTV2_9PELO
MTPEEEQFEAERDAFIKDWKSTSQLLLFAFSVISQLWTPILITELSVGADDSSGTYCAEDPRIFGETTLKYLILFECLMTFFLPFVLTVIADFSVLIMRNPCTSQNAFTLISADEIVHHEMDEKSPLKIVHKSKIMFDMRRRNEAIRRCLLLATVTLLLNLPNYSLQLIDEFWHFRESEDLSIRRKFVRADAIVYIIYLLQFPTVPIYMYCLKTDFDRTRSCEQAEKLMIMMEEFLAPGHLETGHFETGHFETGHFETGHLETGHFETAETHA